MAVLGNNGATGIQQTQGIGVTPKVWSGFNGELGLKDEFPSITPN